MRSKHKAQNMHINNDEKWMNEWMNGWMDEWMDGWMNERTNERTDGRMDAWINEYKHEYINGWMDGWMNADLSMDGWTKMKEWIHEWVHEEMHRWMNASINGWINRWLIYLLRMFYIVLVSSVLIWPIFLAVLLHFLQFQTSPHQILTRKTGTQKSNVWLSSQKSPGDSEVWIYLYSYVVHTFTSNLCLFKVIIFILIIISICHNHFLHIRSYNNTHIHVLLIRKLSIHQPFLTE